MMNALYACGLGLGSNLGDRLDRLQKAVAALRNVPGVIRDSLRKAPVYVSKAIDCPAGAPDFLNTVVTLDFHGDPRQLLRELWRIESTLGRVRDGRPNADRSIDIDLLYAGDLICGEAGLNLPHPRLHRRRFVLRPLADLEPDRVLPGFAVCVSDLCRKVEASRADEVALFAKSW